MNQTENNPFGFKRKYKEAKPVLAVCYDFDKRCSYRFNGHFVCENCGKEVDEFQTYWGELK